MNTPYELTPREWVEVAAVQAVADAFGLEDEEAPARWLAVNAYGVRFDFQTDGPEYAGPLYLIQGAGSPECGPISLIRDADGLLKVLEPS
jgi:hypothetical protein